MALNQLPAVDIGEYNYNTSGHGILPQPDVGEYNYNTSGHGILPQADMGEYSWSAFGLNLLPVPDMSERAYIHVGFGADIGEFILVERKPITLSFRSQYIIPDSNNDIVLSFRTPVASKLSDMLTLF